MFFGVSCGIFDRFVCVVLKSLGMMENFNNCQVVAENFKKC